jgi:tetratricopeptide (TPR) repeat protein
VLAVITLAAYWPVLRNEFIQYDDANYISDNPHVVTGLSWANAKWAFTAGYASNWHPLTWLSHQLDVQLFGLRPTWHHLGNLLFHIANTLLLYLVLLRLTKGETLTPPLHHSTSPLPASPPIHQSTNPSAPVWRCFFVAALFAVHPLHVESVAWAAERKDVLSTFFFLLTLWAYARYAEERSNGVLECRSGGQGKARSTFRFYILALFFYALGLMSKPMLVTTPFVLLLLDFWPLGRFEVANPKSEPDSAAGSPDLLTTDHGLPAAGPAKAGLRTQSFSIQHSAFSIFLEKLPFLLLAAASSFVTVVVQHQGHATSTLEGLPLEPRVSNAILSYLKYLGKTFWPTNLAVFYPHPGIRGPAGEAPDWQVGLALLFLVAVTASFLLRLKREPWLTVGWFWYLGTLVPVIGLLQVGGQAIADRYMYLPSIGLFLLLIWWAADYCRRWRFATTALAALGAAAVLACGVATAIQTTYWRTNLALFQHAAAVTRDNSVAEFNVGLSCGKDAKYDLAVAHFLKALEFFPAYAEAHYSLGVTLEAQGKTEAALAEYLEAAKERPWFALAHDAIGEVYWKLGRREEAVAKYREALGLDPDLPQPHLSLGKALLALGDLPGAAAQLAEAVRLRPADAPSQLTLAKVLIQQGKLAQAEACCRQALHLAPNDSGAHVSLAEVLGMSGQRDEAIAQLTEALRLKPDDATAHKDLGTAFLELAKYAEAATNFAEAVRLQSDYPAARTGLGRALAAQGRMDEASAQFREAARLCPTNAEAQLTLAEALMAGGHSNEAAAAFAAAARLDSSLAAQNLQAGQTLKASGQTDAALARFAAAASLEPDCAEAHENLGTLLAQRGRLDDAARELEETVRLLSVAAPSAINHQLSTNLPQARYQLAMVRVLQGRPADAIANYRQALALDTNFLAALNDLAWLLATDPHAEVRDGPEAVRLAERARDLSGGKEARLWGTLDAAYAEAGRWADATQAAQKALELSETAGQKDLADAARARLALYQNHRPFRQ